MRTKPVVALLVAALSIPLASTAENYHWDSVAIGGGGFVVTAIATPRSNESVTTAKTRRAD